MDAIPKGFFEYIAATMPIVLDGLWFSVRLFLIVLVVAMPLALLFAIARIYAPKPVRRLLSGYVWIFRGTPLVVQLIIVFNGFPHLGIVLDGLVCALCVFILSVAAYETEILRAAMLSIDKGQTEACHVLGMNFFQRMRRVIVPQTVRRVLPTTCSEVIILFKDTSLVTSIAIFDLMRRARNLASMHMRIEPYIVAFVIYLAVASLIVLAFNRVEKRMKARM